MVISAELHDVWTPTFSTGDNAEKCTLVSTMSLCIGKGAENCML